MHIDRLGVESQQLQNGCVPFVHMYAAIDGMINEVVGCTIKYTTPARSTPNRLPAQLFPSIFALQLHELLATALVWLVGCCHSLS